MTRSIAMWKQGPAAMALALLAACGGGGSASGGGTGAAPAAAPAPTPSPSPTPTPTPPPFEFSIAKSPFALGQTQAQSFAVLGFVQAGADGDFEYFVDPATLDTTVEVGFRLAGPADLRFALPGRGEEAVKPNGGGGYATDTGEIFSLGFNALGGAGSLFVAHGSEAGPLKSVAQGFWTRVARPAEKYYLDMVSFLYGIATLPSQVPQMGTFEYRSCCKNQPFASITTDFAAGRLNGSIPLNDKTALTLSEVAIGTDRSAFAGKVLLPGGGGEGTIEGRFAGPAAGEIMARVVYPVADGRAAVLVALIRMPPS